MSETQDNTLRLVQAASEAMTDGMVERMAVTGSNALEVLDRLNDEDTRDAVMQLIDRVTEMHRSGAMDTLFETLALLHAGRSALTDNMVERLIVWAETMVSNVANEHLAEFAGEACGAIHAAAEETADVKGGGLMSTISLMSKPETHQALRFMLSFAYKLQKHVTEPSQD